ncbi:ice-binding family protein [Zafaria cholistanensis]|uniref:ice-binding family protein n=1 Tax=Zafaria cholistanensis TaxID=1682741 RepID=UPI0012303148|nr:ice-binding family protein [Zafaria cholistanensis]
MLAAVSQAYLVILCTLAGAALLPGLFGWHGTVVQTGSMQPHIAPGDVVVLSPLAEQDLIPMNAVVRFSTTAPDGTGQERTPVLHRVTAAHDDGTYTTAGDANPDPDLKPLHREQITGMGRLLVPYIGLPGLWWNTGDYLPLSLWLAGTLLALIAVSRIRLHDPENHDSGHDESATGPLGTEDTKERVSHAPPHRPAPPHTGDSEPENDRDKVLAWISGPAFHNAESAPATGRRVARRAVFGLAGTAALTGLAASPDTRSNAALTARTSTGTSFATASSFPPSLGRAAAFALLAQVKVEDRLTGKNPVASSVSGLIGTSTSGSTITGYPTTHLNSKDAIDAMTDARALFSELKAKTATTTLATPSLSGTITPGVYSYPSGDLTLGNLTLDAKGDPHAVFIIRAKSLATASSSPGTTISLVNGTKLGNVFWCADNTAKILANNKVEGTWIAGRTAQSDGGITLKGRLIAVGDSSTTGNISTSSDTIAIPT